MCSFILVGIIAFLIALLATGIALIFGSTAGFAIGLGLIVFVVFCIIGVAILFLNPDLLL